jgi:hypothetical protein
MRIRNITRVPRAVINAVAADMNRVLSNVLQ